MKRLNAEHGIICSVPDSVLLGYFGWPSVAKLHDGTLAAVASGFRAGHICACGKTVLFTSKDDGRSWDIGQIINDSMADDRDAGIVELPDGRLLVSWFSSDIRVYVPQGEHPYYDSTYPVLEAFNEDDIARYIGSFIRIRELDGRWGKPMQILASTPHGPVVQKNGDLFYLGTKFGQQREDGSIDFKMGDCRSGLVALRSKDGGKTWQTLGRITFGNREIYEPHSIELKDGRILGLIRAHNPFSIAKSFSSDGGLTWTDPLEVTHGSPPHLLRHSSGTIICSYGWREEPGYGQRVMFSDDEGETWDTDWIIRDDGDTGDLGYPATVELDDGSLFTVYYQHLTGHRNAALMWSRWRMPDR